MENTLKRVLLRPRVEANQTVEAIQDICRRMQALETQFSIQNDADLIDFCIYEREALRAQYRYLLRQAKAEGLTCIQQVPLWE